jgi:hypothetical protein
MASIIDQLQLLGTLVFAIPLAMFGVDKLLAGSTDIGLAAVGIAVLMVGLEEYVIKPTDVAADAAKSAAGTVVEDPEESSTDGVETVESEVVDDAEK